MLAGVRGQQVQEGEHLVEEESIADEGVEPQSEDIDKISGQEQERGQKQGGEQHGLPGVVNARVLFE